MTRKTKKLQFKKNKNICIDLFSTKVFFFQRLRDKNVNKKNLMALTLDPHFFHKKNLSHQSIKLRDHLSVFFFKFCFIVNLRLYYLSNKHGKRLPLLMRVKWKVHVQKIKLKRGKLIAMLSLIYERVVWGYICQWWGILRAPYFYLYSLLL